MLDQATEYFLQDKVEEYMNTGTSFTSLDIANAAKEASYRVRNNEVANWLRTNAITISYDGGYLYNQSLIKVDSKDVGMTLAYCYHHYNQSSDDYLDRDQNPKSFMRMVTPVAKTDVSALIGLSPTTGGPTAAIGNGVDTTIFFDTREDARYYARTHNETYKFKDNGWSAAQRWACIPR